MNTPNELKYSKTHEWVKESANGTVKIGISDFAQHALGDIVYVELPQVGDSIEKEASFANVESVKAVSEIFSPVSGKILSINEELIDTPEKINSDPYGSWLIEVGEIRGTAELLDAAAYDAVCAEEE